MYWRIPGVAAVVLAALCGCRGAGPSTGERTMSAVRPPSVARQNEPPVEPAAGAQRAAADEGGDAVPSSAPSRWARWWEPFARPGRIPLPRTDLHLDDFDDEPDRVALDDF